MPMFIEATCQTCEFWKPKRAPNGVLYGPCSRILKPPKSVRQQFPAHRLAWIDADDGSHVQLMTGPDFGCPLYSKHVAISDD